jgi:hypothetical protein
VIGLIGCVYCGHPGQVSDRGTPHNEGLSFAMQDQAYVTRDELDARMAKFEVGIVDRIAALERRIDEHFKAQTRLLIGLYATVAIAAFVIAVKG